MTYTSISQSLRNRTFLLLVVFLPLTARSQDTQGNSKISSWLQLQAVPNLTVTSYANQSSFGLEWEAAPLVYSFGMTRLVSHWHSFIVEPPARFTGSLELVATGQLNTTKLGSSYFAASVQLLGHVPLIERGEYLALNVGVAKYYDGLSSPVYAVVGLSSLFGIVHLNIKRSFEPAGWMSSLEFRLF